MLHGKSLRFIGVHSWTVLLCLIAGARAGENWPQFRGPGSQGHSDSQGLPLQWDEKTNVKWKTEIHGRAWSSPVVWGSQVWVTTASDQGHEMSVLCVDRESGKILRDVKLFDVPNPNPIYRRYNSYASPTPVIEEGRIYVSFGSFGTAALDTATGNVLWKRNDLPCDHWRGPGSSPAVFENLLIIPFDGADHQYLIAMDKRTGKDVWKVGRGIDYKDIDPATGKPKMDGDFRKAFSTPVVATFGPGRPVLLNLSSMALYAYDIDSGKELWRVENRSTHSGTGTPVITPDPPRVFVNSGFSQGELLAVKAGGAGVVTNTHLLWKLTRNVPNKPSLLFVDGLLYMIADNGMASCLDPADGKAIWTQRLKSSFSSSPLYAEGRIYFPGENGLTTILAAGREAKVLAENKLEGKFMSSPAAAGKSLFLRSETHLYRVE